MTVWLLDANVLIALTVDEHLHHATAESWFARSAVDAGFATCAITQGGLVRHLLRSRGTAADAAAVLDSLSRHDAHEFWPCSLDYTEVSLRGVIGHRQVTDAYLAGLARSRGGRLATLDAGLTALHPDIATLIDS